jgi:transposase InsO family protein
VRGQRHRTTITDTTAEPAQDRVPRQCHAVRPNQRWVADVTYVARVRVRRVRHPRVLASHRRLAPRLPWCNHERLLVPLGYVPPAEFEAQFYDTHHTHTFVGVLNEISLLNTRGGSS